MSNPCILIADDSKEILHFLGDTVLRPAGYDVHSVEDGTAALQAARELKPRLLISDQNMPGMSGVDLIRTLRRELPQLPVILISCEASEALLLEALRAGAFDYLVKPFDAEQLLACVERALKETQRRTEWLASQQETLQGDSDLQQRVDELEALAQVGRAVTSMLDLDSVLTAVVDAAVRLTGAEEGILLLLDEESGELYIRASKNFDDDFAKTFRLQVDDSLAGQVIESGKPLLLDEGSLKKIKTAYLVRSLIYVPLLVKARPIGVLGIDNRSGGRNLTQHDTMVMKAMADYAAIAIENARLFSNSEAERIKLETVLTQTENGVIVLDECGRVVIANRHACEALGVEKIPIGRPSDEAFDDLRLKALVGAPGHLPRREEIKVQDGRVFNAQRTSIDGVGQVIVMQDITRLRELDRIKSEFVTAVSHDLRSPLTAVLGYVDLIERSGEVNEQQREFIRRVQASVKRIVDLVGDLLDLGRIESGLDVNREQVDIAVLVKDVVESMRGIAESRDVRLDADVPRGMDPVIGDSVLLKQMVTNLLENAVKFTPPGGGVQVRAEADEGQILLRVIDTGPGISPLDQPYLFDKFYRGKLAEIAQEGTGLGLSIVKSIVDSHDGRIWVDSVVGKGSTFSVVLPTGGA